MKIFLIVLVLAVAYVNSQNGVNGQSSFPKPGSEIWNPENVQTLDTKNPNVHVGRYGDDRKCRQAGALLYQILKNILQIVPETATWYKSILGIDVRSLNAVLRLACSLFNAKTVQQIADSLPGASRDQVRVHYNNLQQYVVQRGGYKGFWKHILIRHNTGRWAKSNGFTVSNSNISQHVDLPTLTKFFKTMQVKYGNRWISGLMEANYIVRVTDVEKFAKGLYELLKMTSNIGTHLFEMLKNDVMTDVIFVVQGTEIKGHRVVVSHAGGPLREMLVLGKAEKVNISKDVAPDTFQTLLEFLYTGNCAVTQKNYFELLHVAMIFELNDLEYHCIKSDVLELTETNVGALAVQALHFRADNLLCECQGFFKYHARDIFKTQEFLDIPGNVLEKFCSVDEIFSTELDLFSACIKWAKAQCKQQDLENTPENHREVLKDVLPLIRFPCISTEDFVYAVVPTKVLTYLEIGKIIFEKGTNEIRTEYSSTCRMMIRVVVERKDRKFLEDWSMTLPGSTTVLRLKTLVTPSIRKYVKDYYLMHEKRCLNDSNTLASILTKEDNLFLRLSLHKE